MAIELSTPEVDELGEVLGALRGWQRDEPPMQLHPGDLGWYWRFGTEATAAAVRTWRRDGRVLAVGLLDERDLVRLALAPQDLQDEELAARVATDLSRPDRGVLGDGPVSAEVPRGALLQGRLSEAGWGSGEAWTPLRCDLIDPVPDPALRVEVVGPRTSRERVAVQQAAFDRSTFTDERWQVMAAGPAYADARCLLARDEHGTAVAAVTVWSAGPGRPGLLEPMGVHRDHRGRGHGRAITLAAAAALRDLGSSSAIVCTRSANVGAVATYTSAGFHPHPEVHDRTRSARPRGG